MAKDDSGHIQIYACMNGITEYKEDIDLWIKKSPKNMYQLSPYYPIYLAVAGNMKPQWGFPYEMLAKVAYYAAEHTKKTENYTRIYQQSLTPCCNQNMINSKTIDFKLLEQVWVKF